MSDQDPTNDPIPGWPSPSEPSGAPEGPPAWAPPSGAPTYPGAQPPPAAGPPGSYPPGGYGPPPNVPPAPGVPAGPGGYGPPPGYGYGGQGYGGQGYGGYPVSREHPQGTTILVLGICGWLLCGLLAPAAWIMGNTAIKEIDRNPAAYSNRGIVQTGRILGMVYTLLVGAFLVLFGVLVIIGLAAGSTSG